MVVEQAQILVLVLVVGLKPELLRYHRDYPEPVLLGVIGFHQLDLSDSTVLGVERLQAV